MTRSYATSVTTDWTQGWIDLSGWEGQAITMTFSVRHPADGFAPWVTLDDVTIGSWTTPYAQVIAPDQLAAVTTGVITITGDNFLATPQVKLNDVPLSDVTWILPAFTTTTWSQ